MFTRACSMIALCIGLGACATSRPEAPAAAAPAPAPAAPLAAAGSAQKSAPPADPREASAARYANEMGYHVEMRHGEKFYCRDSAPIGSRLTHKECMTVDTMAEQSLLTEQNKMSSRQSVCQGAGCAAH